MAVATAMPVPALAQVARDVRDAKREQKRVNNPVRKAVRKIVVLFALIFAVLGFGGGVAQAWPWDVVNNITAFITNFCGPEDVPMPVDHTGVDTLFGLNTTDLGNRQTITIADPNSYATWTGSGLERIQAAYDGSQSALVHPQYSRYGFSTLTWGNYGSGCFSIGYWFTPVANFALQIFVILPTIIAMVSLDLAMGTILSTVFGAIIQPFVSMFTAIFTPWIYFIAPLGLIFVWIKSKGSLQQVAKGAAWIICIVGVFLWIGNNTSMFVVKANNFVTEIAGSAANAINQANQGVGAGGTSAIANGTGEANGSALDSIHQAIWYGLPYQAWLEGQAGPAQASADRALEQQNKLGWGPAILNSLYASPSDAQGKSLRQAVNNWNSLTYAPGTDDKSKTGYWTGASHSWLGPNGSAAWADIPYLFNIKAMCNDQATGTSPSSDAKDNMWMYGGNCDAAGAGTSSMIPYFTGDAYNQRLITAVTGGVGAYANSLTLSAISWYLAAQKMIFFFLILFAPIFLAISTFADEKRRRFATQFFSVSAGNIIKQAVAVMVLLFVANSMSLLMYPPANQPAFALLRQIPWTLKPMIAVLFFIALLLFAVPMRKIITAAAKGDTSIVRKTAEAPVNAAKTAAKVAAVAAVSAATMGVGALAAGGMAGAGGAAALAGKSAGLLGTAGRALAGTKAAGLGKTLTSAARLTQMRGQMGAMLSQRNMSGEVMKAGIAAMTGSNGQSTPETQAYMAKMASMGLVGPDGKLNKAGEAQAKKDLLAQAEAGAKAGQAKKMQDAMMAGMFANYRETHKDANGNPIYHSLDPANPANIEREKIERAKDAQRIKEQAAHERTRENAGSPSTPASSESAPQPTPSQGAPRAPRPGDGGSPAEAGVPAEGPVSAAAPAAGAPAAPAAGGHAAETVAASATVTIGMDAARAAFADAARANVDGPTFARNPDIRANIEVAGADVLDKIGLSAVEAMDSPTRIITSGAYSDLSKMDPQHPATPALNELRFALAQGSDDDIMDAEARVQNIIGSHGLPNQIKTIGVTGDSARAFEPTEVVASMPNISSDTTWQERADAASMMNAVSATIPQGAPAGEAMHRYVSALGDPSVDVALVEAAQMQAMQALRDMQTPAQTGASVFAGGMEAPTYEAAPAPTGFRTYDGFANSGVVPRGMEDLYREAPAPQEQAPVYEAPQAAPAAPTYAEAARPSDDAPTYAPTPRAQEPVYEERDIEYRDTPAETPRATPRPSEDAREWDHLAPTNYRAQEGITREDLRDAFRAAAESGYLGAAGAAATVGATSDQEPNVPSGPRPDAPAVTYSEDTPESSALGSRRGRREQDDEVRQYNRTQRKRSSGLFGDDVDEGDA